MLKGIARIIVYLLLIIPLIVISVLITKQIQFAFDLRKDFIEGNKLKIPFADMQQIMAINELSTRSFFLIFICFLMILCGLLITLKATENAFNTSKETKVKYSLRTAYPGVTIAIFGCLLLAYSVYKSAQLQFTTTQQLITLKTLDSIPKTQLITAGDNIVYQADLDTTTHPPITDETIEEILLSPQEKEKINTLKPSVQPTNESIATPYYEEVTEKDIDWANQLAIRSIAFGYYPTKSDNNRYATILKKTNHTHSHFHLNTDLQWAFRLLQKTQAGYTPSERELKRYEIIVSTQIGNKKQDLENKNVLNF